LGNEHVLREDINPYSNRDSYHATTDLDFAQRTASHPGVFPRHFYLCQQVPFIPVPSEIFRAGEPIIFFEQSTEMGKVDSQCEQALGSIVRWPT
jgi:hypothetical protein